jgi:hypothetical protein
MVSAKTGIVIQSVSLGKRKAYPLKGEKSGIVLP